MRSCALAPLHPHKPTFLLCTNRTFPFCGDSSCRNIDSARGENYTALAVLSRGGTMKPGKKKDAVAARAAKERAGVLSLPNLSAAVQTAASPYQRPKLK